MNDVLGMREKGISIPIQVCDALSRNLPKDYQTHVAKCNAHARREFYEIASHWPQECLKVISAFDIVFLNDKLAKNQKLSPEARLEWH